MSQVPPPYDPNHPVAPGPVPTTPFGENPLRPDVPIAHQPPPTAGAIFNQVVGDDPELRPKKVWIWVSIGVTVGGFVLAAVIGVLGLLRVSGTVDDWARVESPGGVVELDAGEQVVYLEGGFGGDVAIFDSDGRMVPLDRYNGEVTYSFGSNSGSALATIDVENAGRYEVVAPSADIAIGSSIAGGIAAAIILPMLIGGGSFVVGMIMLIIVLTRRSSSRRRAAPTALNVR